MKYFSKKDTEGKAKKDYIRLKNMQQSEKYGVGRVFSIEKHMEYEIEFIEESGQYFWEGFTKKEAIEMLQEAINWIKL